MSSKKYIKNGIFPLLKTNGITATTKDLCKSGRTKLPYIACLDSDGHS